MTGPEAVAALPAKIRVGPFDYRLEAEASIEAHANGRFGCCSNTEQTIRVAAHMPTPFLAVETLLHEINHAIFFSYGVSDDDKQERTVEEFAGAYTSLFRDNPWLIGWISSALGDS